MAENSLQQLLDAEREAEGIVDSAMQARDRMIDQALKQAREEEQRFESRIPEIHESFHSKSMKRAEQTIEELKRRYDERVARLREQAEENEEEALNAAFSLITRTEE
jgi:vacuolar-type H+-ATPase subunit H